MILNRNPMTSLCTCYASRVFVDVVLTTVLFHWDFSHGKFGVAFPGESQLWQSCANQPIAQAGYLSVSIIHQIVCACDLFACAYNMAPRFIIVSSEALLWSGERVCTEFRLWGSLPTAGRKVSHEMVTHPCGDHAWLCLLVAFESKSPACKLSLQVHTLSKTLQAELTRTWPQG